MDFNNNQRFKTAILSELQLADSLKTGAENDSDYHLQTISPEYAFHQGFLGAVHHVHF